MRYPSVSVAAAMLLVGSALAGCAAGTSPNQAASQSGSGTATGDAGPSTSETPEATPTTPMPPAPTCKAPAPEPKGPAQPIDYSSLPEEQRLKPGTNHSVEADAWAYPAAQVQQWIMKPGAKGQPQKKVAFLTFDDGPSSLTPKVLDALKDAGVHATFFQIGKQIPDADLDVQKRIIAEGNALAVHTYAHNYQYLYPGRVANAAHVACDFEWGRYALTKAMGPDFKVNVSRYPGGHMSWKGLTPADAALKKLDDTWLDWNSMSADAEPPGRRPTTVSGMVKMVNSDFASYGGGNVMVVLNHDAEGKHLTVSALPAIIKDLKAKGWSFGILS